MGPHSDEWLLEKREIQYTVEASAASHERWMGFGAARLFKSGQVRLAGRPSLVSRDASCILIILFHWPETATATTLSIFSGTIILIRSACIEPK